MKASDLYNPLVTFVLRSPLHPLMSGGILLLTFTGLKSSRSYTTPISYAREGNTITLITGRRHHWWKNLEGGAAVAVHVQGQTRRGTAQVSPADEATLISAMQRVYPGIAQAKAAQLAPDTVLIRIELAA